MKNLNPQGQPWVMHSYAKRMADMRALQESACEDDSDKDLNESEDARMGEPMPYENLMPELEQELSDAGGPDTPGGALVYSLIAALEADETGQEFERAVREIVKPNRRTKMRLRSVPGEVQDVIYDIAAEVGLRESFGSQRDMFNTKERSEQLVQTIHKAFTELRELNKEMEKADPEGGEIMSQMSAMIFDLRQADWSSD